MNRACSVFTMVAALFAAGCSSPERSRNLANPAIGAVTIARQVCSTCHGVTGTSTSPNFPNLAAQTQPYLVTQLKGFRSHDRQDPAGFEYMWGLTRNLTDEQIDGLAAYYAAQQPTRQALQGNAARRDAGKAIFREGVPAKNIAACAACHGDAAAGNGTFPRLAGQHADYVIKQLVVFQRTDERRDAVTMKTVAHDLSHDDIRNVASYVQSLGNP